MADEDVPCNASMSSSQQASELASLAGSGVDDVVGGQLALCLGSMARLRKTSLSMCDKRDFLEYYHSRSKNKSACKQEQERLQAAANTSQNKKTK